MADKVVIYTHPDCGYSQSLKEEKDAEGVEYEDIDLALRPEEWAALEKHTGGERITPVMVVGETVTIGHNGRG